MIEVREVFGKEADGVCTHFSVSRRVLRAMTYISSRTETIRLTALKRKRAVGKQKRRISYFPTNVNEFIKSYGAAHERAFV